ncbi:MAG: peptidoglycan editing factor PgeF [Oscillospiraceae bacterium]
MTFIQNKTCGVSYMTASNINTVHAFTTRSGGVSTGIFESLNLGENRGDETENVIENYRRLKAALGITGGLVFTKQVHGTEVRRVTREDLREPFEPLKYEADGLMTDIPELPLIIFTADCIPILFFDPVKRAVAASHAGWRGTVADIAGVTVRSMEREFGCMPENIRAAIGPGIGRCCFETGEDVSEAVFNLLGKDGENFIRPSKNSQKFMVDLKGVNRRLLIRAGVRAENIAVSDECTMCLHDKYWSHRFTRGERGSQASVIMLKGKS